MSRQLVRVFSHAEPNTTVAEVDLPTVFTAPIRSDIVQFVFNSLNRNNRQAYAVSQKAGMMACALSWGPGRAVSRVSRVGGSGTSRSGQGAFGNFCRKGRMFNPTTTWRRWHRKVNVTQRRHAVASAVAATAIPSLVLARGHRINQVPEIPLVMDKLNVSKTKGLLSIFEKFGLQDELDKVKDGKKIRCGSGKYRNRRYVLKRGPLVVYDNDSQNVVLASKNIPGVEACHISRLNLLQLAPGGHLGRFVIWTSNAFAQLDNLFGNGEVSAILKKGYVMQRPLMLNANLSRIINSDEIQTIVRPKVKDTLLFDRQKRNPLTNKGIMHRLNPFDQERKKIEKKHQDEQKASRKERLEAKRSERKKYRKQGRAFIKSYRDLQSNADNETIKDYQEYVQALKVDLKKDATTDE